MVRWESLLVAIVLLLSVAPLAEAHKSPVVEYGRAGVWRTEYSFIPRQPVVNEPITLTERVRHYQDEIDGEVRAVFTVYQDDSTNPWHDGKQYKKLDWTLIHTAEGTPVPGVENKFQTTFLVSRPGNYMVTVDLYEDGQYIGQDLRAIDVEKRTIGPAYAVFSVLIIGAVLIGVKRGVL